MNGVLSFQEIENYVNNKQQNLKLLANFEGAIQKFDQDLFIRFVETYKYARNQTNGWDEDAITNLLVKDIMTSLNTKSDLTYNVFKAKGNYETNFGDIAFIIRFNYKNGTSFEGFGFIEAKRDYPTNHYQFRELKKTQMAKFLKNTKSSYYCFYSHEAFFPVVKTEYLYLHLKHLNLPLVKQLNYSLLTQTIQPTTFLQQFNRFLNGFDLDCGEKPRNIAYGYNENFSPKFIIEINNFGENMTPTPTPSNVNLNKYKTFELSSDKEDNDIENDLFKQIDDNDDDDIDNIIKI